MSLNIKNERVYDLAREAARITGKTMTGAVEEALVRLLQEHGEDPHELRRRNLFRSIEEAQRTIRESPEYRAGARMATDSMYDESGLPVW
ncbi:MAG TPA: type II toxin-antitoxin system VapB family antitoxin [Actinomycetales bacterium]|nr:type II toxin-antitoxin system VapB family antitoxin [Actinomycetales bacterium]